MSREKRIYICPKCHQFYSSDISPDLVRCSDCHIGLDMVDFPHERYQEMTPEERKKFKQDYVEANYPEGRIVVRTPYTPLGESRWSWFLQVTCWIFLAVSITVGVYMIASGVFLYGILLVFASFLAVSGIMLFASIADDIRALRNSIERYIYYHP